MSSNTINEIKLFIINRKVRSDRRAHMTSILPNELQFEFTTDWEDIIDAPEVSNNLAGYGLFPWQIDSDNFWWNRPLKKGEVSCSISHWLCWKKSLTCGKNLFMYLEDDVKIKNNFIEELLIGLQKLYKADPSWDLLYLGREPLLPDEPFLDGIVKPGYSHCTFGYMLSKDGVEKLITTNFHNSIIPVDEFLPAMYIDHPREDVRTRYNKALKAYAFSPDIVEQLPKSVAGSDTEATDFI